MTGEPGLFEVIHSTRAMRRLKPDPIPDELVERILRAGQAAPTAGNTQTWGFLVVRDPDLKRQVQAYYHQGWVEGPSRHYAARIAALPPGAARDALQRQMEAAAYLTDHLHEAPVWIVACLRVGAKGGSPYDGASVYPAVQNMLLAARALGLGATLTTRHARFAREVDALFALPEGVVSFAIIPIGYPRGRFGPVRRGALAEVVYRDRWGAPYFEP